MRTLTRRTIATVVAIALILWGSGSLEATGARQWFGYAAIAVALVLAYYALTGRTFLPERDERE